MLDLRSDRTEDRVMGEQAWVTLLDSLEQLEEKNCRHLLVMSSIPVLFLNRRAIENLLGFVPGQQELEDDLLDHWRARTHGTERLRLIHRLLDFARRSGCRVTILSGNVHIGALGELESRRGTPARRVTFRSSINWFRLASSIRLRRGRCLSSTTVSATMKRMSTVVCKSGCWNSRARASAFCGQGAG